MTADDAWFDEIDLDPERSSLAMGTRALGDRPWLVADPQRDAELGLKAHLCAERHAEVFAALDDTEAAGASVEALVQAALVEAAVPGAHAAAQPARPARPTDPRPTAPEPAKSGDLGRALSPRSPDFAAALPAGGDTPPGAGGEVVELHPLDRAGRSTQEDLCLLRRRDDGWYLEAASLCFPSRWRLADKIGLHITEVHGPVRGYADHLASKIDLLFDRLTDRPVWRRNWFLYGDPALFQPAPPVEDPIIEAATALEKVVVRSERQTLRRLPDDDRGGRWLLFTIRVQQAQLARFCDGGADGSHGGDRRRDALDRYLDGADPGSLEHRGLTPAQVTEIRTALAFPPSP